jgi:ubiquinone/menaquinone biosynthesis C-methylase UbiE
MIPKERLSMDQESYEYTGMMAAAWDLLRGDTSSWDDRFFYRDLILLYGQPVLDVGCGTGRLLLDYLAQGIDIDGVDLSPEMLAMCIEKAQQLGLRPVVFEQAMEKLDLPRTYRTILVPSSSFQLLTDPQDAQEAMRRFFRHLEPGGVLVMPFMLLWNEPTTQRIVQGAWELAGEAVRPADGSTIRRWTRSTFDLAQQLESTEDRYEVLRDGAVIATELHMRSPATRWYTQQQALHLYQEAGFTRIHILKEFSQEPASPEDTVFSIIGIRPWG